MILRSEVSVATDPMAMSLDEVRLFFHVAVFHLLQVLHLLHQLVMRRGVRRTASAASVMTSEDHVTTVLVRMVVTYK